MKRTRRFVGLALMALAVVVAGCGGGGGGGSVSKGTQGAVIQITVGDGPADQLVSLQITINSIVLTSSTGATVTVLSTPTTIEAAHLAATSQLLASFNNLPPGTYTKADITVSGLQVKIVDPLTGNVITPPLPSLPPSATTTVNFSPPIVVSSGGVTINVNFDFDLAASITISNTGQISITPTIKALVTQVLSQFGEFEGVTGTVTGVSGSSFTLSVDQIAQSLTILTDSSTVFEGIANISALTTGTIVTADVVVQPDGSFLAKRVKAEIEHETGGDVKVNLEAEGFVTKLLAGPPTQFNMVVQATASSGTTPPSMGTILTVTVDSNTHFEIPSGRVDLTNLPFTPTFASFADMGKAQRVAAKAKDTFSNAALAVELELQTLSGDVSNLVTNGSQATFTLTLPVDSAFRVLTGASSVTVVKQPGTVLNGFATVPSSGGVRVRGLLFLDAGQYKMVAARITTQ